jgi:TDG/mug DNA glycosylase family protein
MAKPLPDYLRPGLDVVFVGINPGLRSSATGHHYAGPGNHFWPLLFESALVDEPLTYEDDGRVLEWKIGLTNMVSRESRSVTELTRAEMREGAATLRRKLDRVRPGVVVFNGKAIYDVYAGRPSTFGRQPERIAGAVVYVMPSTSARTAAYQKADKLAHFIAIRKLIQDERKEAVS